MDMCEKLTDKNIILLLWPFKVIHGHGAKGKIIHMFLSINNSNPMSNSKLFKDIGTFLSKKVNMQSRDQKCTWWLQE